MLHFSLDLLTVSIVIAGALAAGFTTGFAGFGTALVASGLWFHALPAAMVPPLVVFSAVAGQIVGLFMVRKAFDWKRALPYLIGGVIGVPLGVTALRASSPDVLRTMVGAFLFAYAGYRLLLRRTPSVGTAGGKVVDGAVGAGGGFLGGFAGLSGPLPLIWLQLRGGDSAELRATYQPFNLIVLSLAGAGMSVSGQVSNDVVSIAAFCLPATLIGAWIGARAYVGVSEQTFHTVVLMLLLLSGTILVGQAIW